MGSSRQEYGSGLPCPPPGDPLNLGRAYTTVQVTSASTVPGTQQVLNEDLLNLLNESRQPARQDQNEGLGLT